MPPRSCAAAGSAASRAKAATETRNIALSPRSMNRDGSLQARAGPACRRGRAHGPAVPDRVGRDLLPAGEHLLRGRGAEALGNVLVVAAEYLVDPEVAGGAADGRDLLVRRGIRT